MVALTLSNTVSAIAKGLPRRFREVKLPKYPLFSLSSVYHHYLPPKVNCFSGIRGISGTISLQEGEIRSPDLVALEYADLNLPSICEEVGHVRIRQHVNPLTAAYCVFMKSDVLDVAVEMRNQFDNLPELLHVHMVNPSFICDNDGWLMSNPMGIRTEREIHAELEGAKIYRRLYQKSE